MPLAGPTAAAAAPHRVGTGTCSRLGSARPKSVAPAVHRSGRCGMVAPKVAPSHSVPTSTCTADTARDTAIWMGMAAHTGRNACAGAGATPPAARPAARPHGGANRSRTSGSGRASTPALVGSRAHTRGRCARCPSPGEGLAAVPCRDVASTQRTCGSAGECTAWAHRPGHRSGRSARPSLHRRLLRAVRRRPRAQGVAGRDGPADGVLHPVE
jgi:hypothetical protein